MSALDVRSPAIVSFRRRSLGVGVALAVAFALPALADAGSAQGGRPAASPVPRVAVATRMHPTVATPVAPAVRTASFAYAGTTDPDQRLTATWDPSRTGAPWVVTVHGGSWVGGVASGVKGAVTVLRHSGFQVFNLRYRLVGPKVRWADQRSDVLAAIAWIRARAASFGIDPDRGAAYGTSAGGNLALAAGLSGDGTSGVRAIVTVSGVVQPTRLWDDIRHPSGRERVTPAMRKLAVHARGAVGCAYPPRPGTACSARWQAFDLAGAISPHDPAVLMFQGLADRKVPRGMATLFRTRLDRAHVGGALVLVPGVGHNQLAALDGGRRQAAMVAFLRQHTARR